jgi:hypothetical protein
VAVQVAFPFTLFNRRVKNVLLALMITEHLAIAVVLGLPFFSLAMIVADSVFLPTTFLRRVGDAVTRLTGRFRPGSGGGPAESAAGAETAATAGPETGAVVTGAVAGVVAGPGPLTAARVPAQGGPSWAAERVARDAEAASAWSPTADDAEGRKSSRPDTGAAEAPGAVPGTTPGTPSGTDQVSGGQTGASTGGGHEAPRSDSGAGAAEASGTQDATGSDRTERTGGAGDASGAGEAVRDASPRK